MRHHSMSLFVQLLLAVVISCAVLSCGQTAAQCPQANGNLVPISTLSQWTGSNNNTDITVTNQNLLIDQSVYVRNLVIGPTSQLVFADKKLLFSAETIRIEGKFIAGSESCPLNGPITIEFRAKRPVSAMNKLGNNPSDQMALGDYGLAAVTGSTFQLIGNVNGRTWTRLTQTASAGATTITVTQADLGSSWAVGSRIVIASTDFGPLFSWNQVDSTPSIQHLGSSWPKGFPHQNEEFTITAVNGNTLTLDKPLQYTHYCSTEYPTQYCAEVGLLTRNIIVQGAWDTAADQFGGHLMLRDALSIQLYGIEITRMGQLGVLGRYACHWHLFQNIGWQRGFYIKKSSLHHNFQRAVVVHDSNGVTVEQNVAYDTNGHMFFLEDGPEEINTFKDNIGILPRPVASESGRQIIPSDNSPSVFWITNPNNTFTGNVAVSGQFGFWFVMPDYATGISASKYSTSTHIRPRMLPLLQFSNNIAHSASQSCFFVDDMVKADGTTELAAYTPRVGPYTADKQPWEYQYALASFQSSTAFKCRDRGVWARGGNFEWRDTKIFDSKIGLTNPPGNNLFINGLIVGESSNVGYVPPELATIYGSRSRPDQWYDQTQGLESISAIESYDNGGSQYFQDLTIKNFVKDSFRRAGTFSSLRRAPFVHQTRNKYRSISLISATAVIFENYTIDNHRQATFMDQDGSVTGQKPGAWFMPSHFSNFLGKGANCTTVSAWTMGMYCKFHARPYGQLRVSVPDLSATPFYTPTGVDLTQEWTNDQTGKTKASLTIFGDATAKMNAHGNSVDSGFQWQFNAQTRRAYVLRFADGVATPQNLNIAFESTGFGDWAILAIPYPQSAYPFDITPSVWGTNQAKLVEASSVAKLTADQYYYDSSAELLYVLLANQASTTSFNEDFSFVEYGYDGFELTIRAKCQGWNCAVVSNNKNLVPSLPDEVVAWEDQYRGCPVPVSNGVTYSTESFAFFQNTNGLTNLHVTVYHDVPAGKSVRVELFQKITGSSSTRTIAQFPTKLSPSRNIVSLSYDEWASLVKGELYTRVVLSSGSEIQTRLLCVDGTKCKLPPQKPSLQYACTEPNALTLYDDGPLKGWPAFSSWQYNEADYSGSNDWNSNVIAPRCGSSSAKLNITAGSIGYYKPTCNGADISPQCPQYYVVDTAVYKYLQFFVRSAPGFGEFKLSLNIEYKDWSQGKSVPLVSDFDVTASMISNYKIDDTTWSRVRIEVSKLGLNGKANFNTIIFHPTNQWSENPRKTHVFFVDQIQFIPAANADPMVSSGLATSDIKTIASDCSFLQIVDDGPNTGGGGCNGGACGPAAGNSPGPITLNGGMASATTNLALLLITLLLSLLLA